MKFMVVTDIHGDISAVDWINARAAEHDVDLIFALGDITDFGPDEVAEELLGAIDKDVYAIPGNCDPLSLPDTLEKIVFNMHGKAAELCGFYVVGLGGSNPTIFNTPFEISEQKIYETLKPLSRRGMILMVHAPAYGFNDVIPSGAHVGSTSVLNIVQEFRPILVLSGHIHEDIGVMVSEGTTFVNPGPAKEGHYGIITADGHTVGVKLFREAD